VRFLYRYRGEGIMGSFDKKKENIKKISRCQGVPPPGRQRNLADDTKHKEKQPTAPPPPKEDEKLQTKNMKKKNPKKKKQKIKNEQQPK